MSSMSLNIIAPRTDLELGKSVKCSVCGNDEFEMGSMDIVFGEVTFLDSGTRGTTAYKCEHCGFILMFDEKILGKVRIYT